jgi:hypothetical protein
MRNVLTSSSLNRPAPVGATPERQRAMKPWKLAGANPLG